MDLGTEINNEIKKQYDTIYPMILNKKEKFNFPFIDLTSSIDASDYMYIDFSHLSHKGNEKVAENLIFKIKSFKLSIKVSFYH